MARPRDGLVVARTSFFRGNSLVRAGDVWVADDPVVAGYPSAFAPLNVHRSKPEREPVSSEPADPAPRVAGRFTKRS